MLNFFSKIIAKLFNTPMEQHSRPERIKYVMNCYNCGIPLTKKTNNGEHIPPKNLFEGRGSEYKTNRKKIPACYECNNKYSVTDEEFRNLIGIINKSPDLAALTEKTVKSMSMGNAKKNRLKYDSNGNLKAVVFDLDDIKKFHLKNFKGVFYIQYGFPIPNHYRILVDVKEEELSTAQIKLINYAKNNFKWKHSGHPDIFSYIIQPFRPANELNGEDIILKENEKYFICLLRYNKTHSAMVLADNNTNEEVVTAG